MKKKNGMERNGKEKGRKDALLLTLVKYTCTMMGCEL